MLLFRQVPSAFLTQPVYTIKLVRIEHNVHHGPAWKISLCRMARTPLG